MPTFKNITVTISPSNPNQALPSPLPEYGTLKQSRKSTITTFIPSTANVNFAISIIITSQYMTLTNSNNESLAAYVYFDGRSKEETATLLRRGQETWISSRWVQMPDGSLAEKEFVFKEVGLEVQLGSLGLKSKAHTDVPSKKRQTKSGTKKSSSDTYSRGGSGNDEEEEQVKTSDTSDGGLKTNPRRQSMPAGPVTDSDEEEDEPEKATAGQIRVDLFRVLAEGPVKKGEYHAMFKEGDEDEVEPAAQGSGEDKDWTGLEYTAGFSAAKPLDSDSISTQSVSHIDQPNNPYATFVFFYRGERQLNRMGIIPKVDRATTLPLPKPKAKGLDAISGKKYEGGSGAAWEQLRGDRMMDDDDDADKEDDGDPVRRKGKRDLPDDDDVITATGNGIEGEELSEGVRKMKLKRGFAEDPDDARKSSNSATSATPGKKAYSTSAPSSNAFSPFTAGGSAFGASNTSGFRQNAPNGAYRRNGSASSASKNGGIGGLASPKSPKFGRSDSTGGIPGLGFGGTSAAGVPVPGAIRGSDATASGTSSGSDDDKYVAKKRRWSKPAVAADDEDIL